MWGCGGSTRHTWRGNGVGGDGGEGVDSSRVSADEVGGVESSRAGLLLRGYICHRSGAEEGVRVMIRKAGGP